MKIGLALSGGGAKGLAHIGVLEALNDLGINIDYIAGTSSGSIIASLYAAGYTPKQILKMTINNKYSLLDYDKMIPFKLFSTFITKKVSIKGFVKGNKIERLLKIYLRNKNIEDISDVKMPLAIPAIDLKTAEIVYFVNCAIIKEESESASDKIPKNQISTIDKSYDDIPRYLNKGNLAGIIRASSSFPGIFVPKILDNKQYIDGGIRVNTPVNILRQMGAEKVIAITFTCNKRTKFGIKNIIGISAQAFNILNHSSSEKEQLNADLNIKLCLNDVSLLDFTNPSYVVKRGYNIIYNNMDEIKKRLNI